MPPLLSNRMSGSPRMTTGSFSIAWSNVIPFDRLVVGPRGAGAVVVAAAFAFCLSAELREEPVAPLDGIVAKLSIARRTPTEQREKASKMRGLKRPD